MPKNRGKKGVFSRISTGEFPIFTGPIPPLIGNATRKDLHSCSMATITNQNTKMFSFRCLVTNQLIHNELVVPFLLDKKRDCKLYNHYINM
jgi:hypothetical protein